MPSTAAFTANLLRTSSRAYASAAIANLQQARPDLLTGGLPPTFARPIDDTEVRILHLAESVGVDRPALFEHAVAWYRVAFHHRQVPADYLQGNLVAIAKALQEELPKAAAELAGWHLQAAMNRLATAPVDLPSAIVPDAPHGRIAGRFLLAILEGRGDDALDLMREELDRGLSLEDAHDHVLTPVQREAGRMWLMGEIPIADEHYGSTIVDRALSMLQDRLPRPRSSQPHVLMMGVGGNLHDMGLRIVAQRLQLAGFVVHNLGANMPAGDLEWAMQERRVDLVAVSATLTLHLHALADTVATVRRLAAQRPSRLPVLVGGEPFALVHDLYSLVGADAGAADAAGAVAAARRLVGG